MRLIQQRLFHTAEETISALYLQEPEQLTFLCWILEDQPQTQKVYAETRIPSGVYNCRLRTWGRVHENYLKKFAGMHFGTIEIMEIPGFQDILFHIGNDDDDTAGCLLPGTNPVKDAFGRYTVTESTKAYLLVYQMLAEQLKHNFPVLWEIRDEVTS
jgi:hypothetical protein